MIAYWVTMLTLLAVALGASSLPDTSPYQKWSDIVAGLALVAGLAMIGSKLHVRL